MIRSAQTHRRFPTAALPPHVSRRTFLPLPDNFSRIAIDTAL
jgi:hypothetical protein